MDALEPITAYLIVILTYEAALRLETSDEKGELSKFPK